MNGIIQGFTLTGVAVFALSGALLGLRNQMDIIGCAVRIQWLLYADATFPLTAHANAAKAASFNPQRFQ